MPSDPLPPAPREQPPTGEPPPAATPAPREQYPAGGPPPGDPAGAEPAATPGHPVGGRTATVLAPPPRSGPGPQPTRPAPSGRDLPHGPWPDLSPLGRRWPGPGRPAAPAGVAVLTVAAVVAALSVPLGRVGVGWLVAAIAGTAALALARRLSQRVPTSVPQPRLTFAVPRRSPDRFAWAAATVALLGVGTLRSAGWLFVLCVLTAAVTGALAAAGGRSVRGMATAVAIAPLAMFLATPWVARGVLSARRRGSGAAGGVRVTATIAVSVALLVVFGSLFASADATFARVLSRAVPDVDVASAFEWFWIFLVAGGVLGGAAFLRAAPPDLSGMTGGRPGRVSRLEWAIPLGLLTVLFAMFVAVQIAVLFGGSRHVLDTDGLTYADYARGGFWQLLVVTGLTLVVLAGAVRWAPRATAADRTLIRSILGALAVLTLVIVASALHRMDVYADTYGLTRLRVLVFLCELWLGLTFLLVLVAGIRLRADWLPRAVVGLGVLTLLALAVANPDRLIAERNVARFAQTQRIDLPYLSRLSPDAVPALDRLGDLDRAKRDCVLNELHHILRYERLDWRSWSYGREHARALLAADPPGPPVDCPAYYRG